MSSILPTAAAFRKQVADYVGDTRHVVEACVAAAEKNDAFADVYKISLAADTVLASLSSAGLTPSVSPARAVALRVPLLVIIGQSSTALAELRRFVELILWTIYFTDHRIEWEEFASGPGGFTRDTTKPISFAARRELNYYLGYARELMEREPSGIALRAISGIDDARKTLNASVHAGRLARSKGKLAPYDSVETKELRRFCRLQRATFSSCCIALAAYRRSKFDKMTAVGRAYFDFLVGSTIRKQVRSGPFGLP